MTLEDRQKRVKFNRRVKKLDRSKFWKNKVLLYIDGTGFEFKTSPLDQARAPRAREWRRRSEGLKVTAKGKVPILWWASVTRKELYFVNNIKDQ